MYVTLAFQFSICIATHEFPWLSISTVGIDQSSIIGYKSNPNLGSAISIISRREVEAGMEGKDEWIPSQQSGQSGSRFALVCTSAERPSSVHSRVQCGKSSAVGCGRSFPAVKVQCSQDGMNTVCCPALQSVVAGLFPLFLQGLSGGSCGCFFSVE